MNLIPKSGSGYTVIEQSKCTDLDKEIWGKFDQTIENLCWGQVSVPDERYAIRRTVNI